ncbi:MAG: nucleotide exchange factor GrpE [bacterium]
MPKPAPAKPKPKPKPDSSAPPNGAEAAPMDDAVAPDESAPPTEPDLAERLAQADDEIARLNDSLLRAKAEVENIRRRSQNEIADARKFAIKNFVMELLVVKDSLDQAAMVEIDHGADAAAEVVARMKEGVGLTAKQLDLALAKFAVVEIAAALGARFDPECHQAISTAPSAEVEAGCIVEVVQKGFALNERLLRPAMVVVAADDGQ